MEKQNKGRFGSLFLGCALAVALLGGSGCASFQGNKLNPVASFPQVETKKTVDVDFECTCFMNEAQLQVSDAVRKKYSDICVKRLRASGLFKEVAEEVVSPDLKLEITFEDEGSGSMGMAMLTGATFYVIPSKVTETYRVSAVLRNTKTDKKIDIKLEDSFTQWQQILLLPLLPFKSTIAESAKCQNKLFDNLALEIHKTGMIN